MSDFNDMLNENDGAINAYAQIGAIAQRRDLIEKQKLQTLAIQSQTRELESQTRELQKSNRIEQDRANIENQRLSIESQRAQAEASERKHRRLQADQLKQVRVLMADCMESIERLKKLKPI